MTHEPPSADDERTLRQLREIFGMDLNIVQALSDAYHLGRIRGRLEGAEEAAQRMSITS